jgi:hypothetical protein
VGGLDPPRRLDAVDRRHAHVDHDDIRLELGGHADRRLAVFGLADDVDVLLDAEQRSKPVEDDSMIVGDHHAQRPGPHLRCLSNAFSGTSSCGAAPGACVMGSVLLARSAP